MLIPEIYYLIYVMFTFQGLSKHEEQMEMTNEQCKGKKEAKR